MADRTVKVKLTADISDYTAQLAKAAAATRQLGGDVEKGIDRNVSPAMTRAGEKQGGILAKGINAGLVRNSPLIAAAIGGALAAGGPLLLASAGVLFGAVGALAAAQTTEVRDAWTELGHTVRDGAVQDASVLVPVYVGMAEKIGAAFQRMRPELRDAFEAAAPQIDRFTDGLTQAAENALPGLVRAVEAGGPVIDGLASLMEDVGTGLSDFFDAMSDNSGAAGEALESIGDALGEALPLLGDLLGTGAEIAADVLPALAGGLGLVRDVVRMLGPALAPVATGFLAFKAASTAAGWLTAFATAAQRAGVANTGLATGLTGASKAMPFLALATMGVTTALAEGDKGASEFEAAVMSATIRVAEGGEEGRRAQHELDVLREGMEKTSTGYLGMGADIEGAWARGRAAGEQFTGSANEVASAEDRVAAATDRATAAMSAQADLIMASADADLAKRQAIDATEQAMTDLATAIATYGADSEQAADAAMNLESMMINQARAAANAALTTSSATSESGKKADADAAQLAELLRLKEQYGSAFPAALDTTIERLRGTTTAGGLAAAQFNNLGLEVLSVPNSKQIIVSSTTPEQIAQLQTLGYTVRTLPDGRVEVTAATADAEAAITHAARNRSSVISVTYSLPRGGAPVSAGLGVATGGAIENGRVQHFDGGGAVRGPGGPRADLVPAMLSNGEHVWNSAEVAAAGGQAAVAAMRRSVLAGRERPGASMQTVVVQSSASPTGPSGPAVHIDNYNEARQSVHEIAEDFAFIGRTRG